MGYVYRYTDLTDNVIKYVGIVWSDNRTLLQRIKEHYLYDEWCKDKEWKIEYLCENIDTRTDAEYMEAHYIARYETNKYYNKAKSGWGISSFIQDRDDWQLFDNEKENEINDIKQENNKLHRENKGLLQQITVLSERLERYEKENCRIKKELHTYKQKPLAIHKNDVSVNSEKVSKEKCVDEPLKISLTNKTEPMWSQNKSLYEGKIIKNKRNTTDELFNGRNRVFYSRKRKGTNHVLTPCKLMLYVNGKKREWRYFDSINECSDFCGLTPQQISDSMKGTRHYKYWRWRKEDDFEYLTGLYDDEERRLSSFDVLIRVCAITPLKENGEKYFNLCKGAL